MRRTYNASLIYHEAKFLGVDLGADHCAEHEFGIKGINEAFGINSSLMGIDRYRNFIVPGDTPTCNKLHMFTTTKFTDGKMPWVGLYFSAEHYCWDTPIKKLLPLPIKHTEEEICAAWDSKSFGIVMHKDSAWVIDELVKAANRNDLAIGIGHGGPFRNGGLKLMIISQMPSSMKDSILAEHKDYAKLMKAVEKTGIVDYLAKHGKGYYALSPQWYSPNFKPGRDLKTKYKLVFFLNPMQQSKYNVGWYTVEELKDWANDKGIIVK